MDKKERISKMVSHKRSKNKKNKMEIRYKIQNKKNKMVLKINQNKSQDTEKNSKKTKKKK